VGLRRRPYQGTPRQSACRPRVNAMSHRDSRIAVTDCVSTSHAKCAEPEASRRSLGARSMTAGTAAPPGPGQHATGHRGTSVKHADWTRGKRLMHIRYVYTLHR